MWHLLENSLPCGRCLGILYLVGLTWELFTLWHLLGNSLPCCICFGFLYLVVSALDFSNLLYLLGNSLPHGLLWEFSSSWPLFGNSPPCGLRGALLTLSLLGNLYYMLCLKKKKKFLPRTVSKRVAANLKNSKLLVPHGDTEKTWELMQYVVTQHCIGKWEELRH